MYIKVNKTNNSISGSDISEFYVKLSYSCDIVNNVFIVSPTYYLSIGDNPFNCDVPISTQTLNFNSYPSEYDLYNEYSKFFISFGYDTKIINDVIWHIESCSIRIIFTHSDNLIFIKEMPEFAMYCKQNNIDTIIDDKYIYIYISYFENGHVYNVQFSFCRLLIYFP
jgi:hypothetical protein